jgi:hypothetical protein
VPGSVDRDPGERVGRRGTGHDATLGLGWDVVEPQRLGVLVEVPNRTGPQLGELLEILEQSGGELAAALRRPILGPVHGHQFP